MMNILTVFNIIPDLDLISEAEWASDIVDTRLNFPGVKTVPEAQDESAAELALRFRDAAAAASADSVAVRTTGSPDFISAAAAENEVRLSAVTLGDTVADKALRTLTALGYQSADRIDTDRPGPDNEESHAALLAEYCRKRGPFDLILTGTQSGVSGFSQLPLLLAATQAALQSCSGARLHKDCLGSSPGRPYPYCPDEPYFPRTVFYDACQTEDEEDAAHHHPPALLVSGS